VNESAVVCGYVSYRADISDLVIYPPTLRAL